MNRCNDDIMCIVSPNKMQSWRIKLLPKTQKTKILQANKNSDKTDLNDTVISYNPCPIDFTFKHLIQLGLIFRGLCTSQKIKMVGFGVLVSEHWSCKFGVCLGEGVGD